MTFEYYNSQLTREQLRLNRRFAKVFRIYVNEECLQLPSGGMSHAFDTTINGDRIVFVTERASGVFRNALELWLYRNGIAFTKYKI